MLMPYRFSLLRIAPIPLLILSLMACDSDKASISGATIVEPTGSSSTESEADNSQAPGDQDNASATPTNYTVDTETAPQSDNCPQYENSALYRSRENVLIIAQDDNNWEQKIRNAQAGTEILLMDGEYLFDSESIFLNSPDITIRSLSGNRDAVVIRGLGLDIGSNEGFMIAADRITIADITMHNLRRHAIAMKPGFDDDAILDQSYIYNVNLYDIGTQQIKGADSGENRDAVVACSRIGYTPGAVSGDYIGAIGIFEGSNVIVRDNYIYNINGEGTGCNAAVPTEPCNYDTVPAIYLRLSRDSIVERNIIIDSWRGISLGLTNGHTRGIIRNNFIYRSGPGDMGISVENSINTIVEHNTVFVNDYWAPIQVRGGSGHIFRNNLTSAPIQARDGAINLSIEGNGNIEFATIDELTAPTDPHLKPDSIAIGAGVAPTTVNTDIDGELRSGGWDVGADQYSD